MVYGRWSSSQIALDHTNKCPPVTAEWKIVTINLRTKQSSVLIEKTKGLCLGQLRGVVTLV